MYVLGFWYGFYTELLWHYIIDISGMDFIENYYGIT